MFHVRIKNKLSPPRPKMSVAAFPNMRPPTKREENAALLRDLNAMAQVFSDGVGTFTLLYCALNWITYRRMQRQNKKDDDDDIKQ